MTTSSGSNEDVLLVGPILATGEVAAAITAAIVALNPGVSIVDRGSYVRVMVPGRCHVTRAMIECHLGAPFELPRGLEAVMMSFKGALKLTPDAAEWLDRREAGASMAPPERES